MSLIRPNPYKKITLFDDFVFLGSAVFLGFISTVIPPYVLPAGIKSHSFSPLFPFITTAIENLAFYPTIIGLFASGNILAFLKTRMRFLSGIATIWLFPFLAFLEILYNPTSHNLWPFEFLIYALLSIPAYVGYHTHGIIAKILIRWIKQSDSEESE